MIALIAFFFLRTAVNSVQIFFSGVELCGQQQHHVEFYNVSWAAFTSHPNLKYFFFHPSHQIFRRMHGVLNVGKKDN
jgi:hypothetical protein